MQLLGDAATGLDAATVSAVCSAIAAAAAAVIAFLQASAAKQQNDLTVLGFVVDRLQEPKARESRRFMFQHEEEIRGTGLHEDDEEKHLFPVWINYDLVWKISDKSRWTQQLLIRDWGRTAALIWDMSKDHLFRLRKERRDENLWIDFQRFGEESKRKLKM